MGLTLNLTEVVVSCVTMPVVVVLPKGICTIEPSLSGSLEE